MNESQRQMIASFSYGTLTKQNASSASDIGDEETTVAESLDKKKKNIVFIHLVE